MASLGTQNKFKTHKFSSVAIPLQNGQPQNPVRIIYEAVQVVTLFLYAESQL